MLLIRAKAMKAGKASGLLFRPPTKAGQMRKEKQCLIRKTHEPESNLNIQLLTIRIRFVFKSSPLTPEKPYTLEKSHPGSNRHVERMLRSVLGNFKHAIAPGKQLVADPVNFIAHKQHERIIIGLE